MTNNAWYIVENGVSVGPMNEEQIAGAIKSGRISSSTLVWRDGFQSWKKLAESELAGMANSHHEHENTTAAAGRNEQEAGGQTGESEHSPGWYIMQGVSRTGPFSLGQAIAIFKAKGLRPDTMVWTPGFDEWRMAKDTAIAAHMRSYAPLPPLSNIIIWLAALSPILGMFIASYIFSVTYDQQEMQTYTHEQMLDVMLKLALIRVSFQTLMGAVDIYLLKKAGYQVFGMVVWMLLLFPVYLFLRAKKLGQKQTYLLVWLASLLIVFFIAK